MGDVGFVVRRVEPEDRALWQRAVEKLIPVDDRGGRTAGLEELETALEDPRCYALLATEAAQPVGVLTAYRFPDLEAGGQLAYLYDIEVGVAYRRRGIGSALLETLLERCRRDGVGRVWAGTSTDNVGARRAFEEAGAELEGDGYAEYEWDLEA